MAAELGEQVDLMIEGLLVQEASTFFTITWGGAEYVVTAGPEFGGKRLEDGGFRLAAKVKVMVRTSLFPVGIGYPKEKQTVIFKRNATDDGKTLRIESINDFYGAALELNLDDPNKSA